MKVFAFFLALLAAFSVHLALAIDVAKGQVTVACRVQRGNATCVLPKVTTMSGEEATIAIENVSISILPTIENDGTVTVATKLVINAGKGPVESIVSLPKVTTLSGQPANVAFEGVTLTMNPVIER